ncbi:hypothetical protein COCOBI_13-2830 [Coccomyxa sp. Obi]|nr:hypothetical protein COCOBI_13-2830 [Coccomyxa sp. Obi]
MARTSTNPSESLASIHDADNEKVIEAKHVPFGDEQSKTGEASKAAHDAGVHQLESQQQVETARARLAELEEELEGMRTRGVNMSAKQQEVEIARRAAEEAETRFQEASLMCQLTEYEARVEERDAMKGQPGLDNERRSLQSIQEELAKMQKELQGAADARHKAFVAVADLEEELEVMRIRGVDMSAKQQEVEIARRAAEEAETRFQEASLMCQLTEYEAMYEQREALEAQRLDEERRRLLAIEDHAAEVRYLLNASLLQKSKAEAQSCYEHIYRLQRDHAFGSKRLNKERQSHANAVQEAEGSVAEEPPFDYSKATAYEEYNYKVLNATLGFFGVPGKMSLVLRSRQKPPSR